MESILNEEKQMTGIMVKHKPGASSASATWDAINWQTVQVQVKRLQIMVWTNPIYRIDKNDYLLIYRMVERSILLELNQSLRQQ